MEDNSLSLINLIFSAGLVVKFVMLVLVLMSIYSWTVIMSKKKVLMDDGTVKEVEVSAVTPWDTLMGLLSADQYNQISDIVRSVADESLLLE